MDELVAVGVLATVGDLVALACRKTTAGCDTEVEAMALFGLDGVDIEDDAGLATFRFTGGSI